MRFAVRWSPNAGAGPSAATHCPLDWSVAEGLPAMSQWRFRARRPRILMGQPVQAARVRRSSQSSAGTCRSASRTGPSACHPWGCVQPGEDVDLAGARLLRPSAHVRHTLTARNRRTCAGKVFFCLIATGRSEGTERTAPPRQGPTRPVRQVSLELVFDPVEVGIDDDELVLEIAIQRAGLNQSAEVGPGHIVSVGDRDGELSLQIEWPVP